MNVSSRFANSINGEMKAMTPWSSIHLFIGTRPVHPEAAAGGTEQRTRIRFGGFGGRMTIGELVYLRTI